jgi:cytochrome subunit of sulfide dehydrogenase
MARVIGLLILPMIAGFMLLGGVAIGDETAPAVLAAACVSCHSPKATENAIPPLVDLTADDIRMKLIGYRADTIEGTIMNRIAKGYTDAEIDALAAEIAAWEGAAE